MPTPSFEDLAGRDDLIVVTGAGGFIGGHMVSALRDKGYRRLRAVDRKPQAWWFQAFDDVDNLRLDLRDREACYRALDGAAYVFNFAADMGGMGFIESHKAMCMLSVLINTHLLLAARDNAVKRYFYASSACVYAADKQTDTEVTALEEADAYPAMPEDGYGWEKLFSERMCRHFTEDFGLETRVARYHNVYGPLGTYDGGREKAPAALCRKVIRAKASNDRSLEIWGDGEQRRSFMYIDDCLRGTLGLMASDCREPLNVGSAELVSINELVDMIEAIAGVEVERRYEPDAPQGVRGRNSDNTRLHALLGWEPDTPLRQGLHHTYAWIAEAMRTLGDDNRFAREYAYADAFPA